MNMHFSFPSALSTLFLLKKKWMVDVMMDMKGITTECVPKANELLYSLIICHQITCS